MVTHASTGYNTPRKDYHNYRLMLNLQNRFFTGLPMKPAYDFIPGFQSEAKDPAEYLVAQFMHQNCFTGLLDRNENGWTPLCYAALSGDPLLVYSLLQEKADPNDAIAEPETLCQFAAQTSALHMCAFLKRNESLRNHADGYGATALHWAAVADNAEGLIVLVVASDMGLRIRGIQILCDAGLGCHVPNMLGYSPFAMACAGGGVEAIQELIAYASREELAEGLHAALLHGGASAKLVSLLVAAGVDVNHQLTKPLLSPLGAPLVAEEGRTGDLRSMIKNRIPRCKKAKGQMRKLEARLVELGGELSEEVSSEDALLGATSSEESGETSSDDTPVKSKEDKEKPVVPAEGSPKEHSEARW
ncbi:Invs [Symbiodinium microadriaticum]|nr:Invs [Symbiodinium microadriaticum]